MRFGLHKKQVTDKNGKRTTVWVKSDILGQTKDRIVDGRGNNYSKDKRGASVKKDKFEPRVLHSTYGSAIDEAAELATQSGYNKQSSDDVGAAFMDAFFKPKKGQTNRKSIEMVDDDGKLLNHLHVQIYNRGTSGNTFELNTYFDKKPKSKKVRLKEMNKKLNEVTDMFIDEQDEGGLSSKKRRDYMDKIANLENAIHELKGRPKRINT